MIIKSLSVSLLFIFLLIPAESNARVVINEVLASNGAGVPDEDGDTVPWIELYNSGDESVDLYGFGLSDDYDRPYRWVVPDITIEPGEFLLIFASGKDRDDPDGELHTNFRVSRAGEEVLLTTPDGERMDEMPPTPMETDISFGRQPDGAEDWYFFDDPTPGSSNTTEGFLEILEPPEFSRDGGFYTSPFMLDISHPDPDVTIYYTMDGSEPDENSQKWDEPMEIRDRSDEPNSISTIPTTNMGDDRPIGWVEPEVKIRKATVIRAKAVKTGHVPSHIQTRTFFVHPDGYELHQLPVFSFATDSLNLFDHDKGIYVPGAEGESGDNTDGNFMMRGIEWERPASMEFYEDDGERVLTTDMGIRIHGGYSRIAAQKSLRLYARNDYGDSRFEYRFFPDEPYEEFNRLLLRNSGNDWGNTLFRDAMGQRVIEHMDFDTQAYRPSVVYINGEYWGIHNIRERYDKHYLERVYDVDPENIDLLTGNEEVKEGDPHHLRAMRSYAADNDLSKTEHYEHMKTLLDIDHYLDYYTAQVYLGNTDWPQNNIDFWRLRTEYDPDQPAGKDGRWRWLLYDIDFSFNYYAPPDVDMLEWVTAEEDMRFGEKWPNKLFINLLENEQFKSDFVTRIAGHLNTTFQPERIHNIIDNFEETLETEIKTHVDRWNRPTSHHHWRNGYAGIGEMREFTDERPDYLRQQVLEHFDIDRKVELNLNISDNSGGYIRVDSIDIKSSTPGVSSPAYPWQGIYFEDIPLELNAYSWPGYEFSHWIIDGETIEQSSVTVSMEDDTQVEAAFAKADDNSVYPEPFTISSDTYRFREWPANADPGTYPDNMAFVYMDEPEPDAKTQVDGFTNGAYNLDSRTRIMGLGDGGFAFINTSNLDGNPGYPGRRLGGAILALDTRGADELYTMFTAGTVLPNSRIYNIRLQYRLGNEGPFNDVEDESGHPVEYHRNEIAGHTREFGPLELPEYLLNQPYVQLLWRYYYTGHRITEDSGQRSKMNISDILVSVEKPTDSDNTDPAATEELVLNQNYPNPFNNATEITFELPESAHTTLRVYAITGEQVATLVDEQRNAGVHQVSFEANNLSSGVFIYRLETEHYAESRKMLLVR